MRRSPLRSAIPVLLLAASASAEPVLLRYRPHPAPLDFRVRVEEQATVRGSGREKTSDLWTESEVRKRSIRTGEGRIGSLVETLATRVGVGGRPGVRVQRKGSPNLGGITTRGAPLSSAPARSPGQEIHPVFPEEPVEVGHTWQETISGTARFSPEVTVTHRLEAIRPVAGHRCAVVVSEAMAKGIDEASRALVAVRTKSTLALSLEDGEVVELTSRGRVSQHHPAPRPDGSQVVKKQVKKTMRRVPGS